MEVYTNKKVDIQVTPTSYLTTCSLHMTSERVTYNTRHNNLYVLDDRPMHLVHLQSEHLPYATASFIKITIGEIISNYENVFSSIYLNLSNINAVCLTIIVRDNAVNIHYLFRSESMCTQERNDMRTCSAVAWHMWRHLRTDCSDIH